MFLHVIEIIIHKTLGLLKFFCVILPIILVCLQLISSQCFCIVILHWNQACWKTHQRAHLSIVTKAQFTAVPKQSSRSAVRQVFNIEEEKRYVMAADSLR